MQMEMSMQRTEGKIFEKKMDFKWKNKISSWFLGI